MKLNIKPTKGIKIGMNWFFTAILIYFTSVIDFKVLLWQIYLKHTK